MIKTMAGDSREKITHLRAAYVIREFVHMPPAQQSAALSRFARHTGELWFGTTRMDVGFAPPNDDSGFLRRVASKLGIRRAR